ncbi:hypothetical protein D3C80_2157350 [compost metagenome]
MRPYNLPDISMGISSVGVSVRGYDHLISDKLHLGHWVAFFKHAVPVVWGGLAEYKVRDGFGLRAQ